MDALVTGDKLEILGASLGLLIVLGGLGSLVGMPWETNPDTLAVLAQLLGVALTVAVGAGLIWIVRQE